MITFQRTEQESLSYCTIAGKHLELLFVEDLLQQKVQLVSKRAFSSFLQLQQALADESLFVTIEIKSLSRQELSQSLNTVLAFIQQKKSESEIIELLREEIIPQKWLLEPSLSHFFVTVLKSALYNNQESLVQLLLEKGADIALINAQRSSARSQLLYALINSGAEYTCQKNLQHPAALPLLFHLLEMSRLNSEYRDFLSDACTEEFIAVFQAYFSEELEQQIDYERAVEALDNILQFAKENSFVVELPINVQEGLKSLFNLTIKKGAFCLFSSILENTPLFCTCLKELKAALQTSIKYRRKEEFDALFKFISQEEQVSFAKKNLHFCIRFDSESIFDTLVSYLNAQEMSLAAEFSLDYFESKYLEKLIALGAKIDLSRAFSQIKIFTIVYMLQNSLGEEGVEGFVSLIIRTQLNQEALKEILEKLLGIQNRAKQLSIPQMVYRVRTSSSTLWSASYGGESVQDLYDREFQTTLYGAILLIEKQVSFRRLLDFLAIRRNKIACLVNQPRENLFGLWRTPLMQVKTTLSGRYEKYLNKVRQKIEEGDLEGFSKAVITQNGEIEAEVFGVIEGEALSLTKIDKDTWIHSGCLERDKIVSYAGQIYQEILRSPVLSEENPKFDLLMRETVRKIIHIHWWMAHATPHARGSAAIIEMLVRALFISRNIQTTSWKEDTVVDCEALVEGSLNRFCNLYATFMETGFSYLFRDL